MRVRRINPDGDRYVAPFTGDDDDAAGTPEPEPKSEPKPEPKSDDESTGKRRKSP
jgi:hypothetical protein